MRKHAVVYLLGIMSLAFLFLIEPAGANPGTKPVLFPEFKGELALPVSKVYTPVGIFRDGELLGAGTVVLTPQGYRVITDASLFWADDTTTHVYTIARGFSEGSGMLTEIPERAQSCPPTGCQDLPTTNAISNAISSIQVLAVAGQSGVAVAVGVLGKAKALTGLKAEDRAPIINPRLHRVNDHLQSVDHGDFRRVYVLFSDQALCLFEPRPLAEVVGSGLILDDGTLVVLGVGRWANTEALRRDIPEIPVKAGALAEGIVVHFDPWDGTIEIPKPADVSRPFFKP